MEKKDLYTYYTWNTEGFFSDLIWLPLLDLQIRWAERCISNVMDPWWILLSAQSFLLNCVGS
jgi:hypothetical protein